MIKPIEVKKIMGQILYEYQAKIKPKPPDVQSNMEEESSVVEHSSANPKVPGSIPGLVSYWGHGL